MPEAKHPKVIGVNYHMGLVRRKHKTLLPHEYLLTAIILDAFKDAQTAEDTHDRNDAKLFLLDGVFYYLSHLEVGREDWHRRIIAEGILDGEFEALAELYKANGGELKTNN